MSALFLCLLCSVSKGFETGRSRIHGVLPNVLNTFPTNGRPRTALVYCAICMMNRTKETCFQIFTEIALNLLFCGQTSCRLGDLYQCFGGICCLHRHAGSDHNQDTCVIKLILLGCCLFNDAPIPT
jgi:hypothetical protein